MNERYGQSFDWATVPHGIYVPLRWRDPTQSRRAESMNARAGVDHSMVFARIVRALRQIISCGTPLSRRNSERPH
jgi:hypothetical protein